jgi:SAM-dependent methyltransferase
MSSQTFEYSGSELEALSLGENYYAWIRRLLGPRLRGRVVEVGAGRGTFSERLLAMDTVDELILIEPDAAMHADLEQRLGADPRVTTHAGYFGSHDLGGPVDAIVLVNVLEHIEDDAGVVAAARAALAPGGALLLFVPAGPWLFGSLDRAFEHFRRYERPGLMELLTAAGMEVADVHYVNAPGMLAWFIAGKVLRQNTVKPGQMKLYDRLVVPLVSRFESILRPPRGQSLVAISIKPSMPDPGVIA